MSKKLWRLVVSFDEDNKPFLALSPLFNWILKPHIVNTVPNMSWSDLKRLLEAKEFTIIRSFGIVISRDAQRFYEQYPELKEYHYFEEES